MPVEWLQGDAGRCWGLEGFARGWWRNRHSGWCRSSGPVWTLSVSAWWA